MIDFKNVVLLQQMQGYSSRFKGANDAFSPFWLVFFIYFLGLLHVELRAVIFFF